ncbi:NUDIX hydrolase domain-like protein [Cladochytrium replicatum]|nr:NUDIX hydrolase domain-like protein [Cladochytrium replicatum]
MEVVKEESYGIVALRARKGSWTVDDLDVLVIQQKSGNHWTLTKGHVEPTDTGPMSTALRELYEETQIRPQTILLESRIFSNGYRFERSKKRWDAPPSSGNPPVIVEKSNHFFVGIVASEDAEKVVLQESEVVAWKWVPLKDSGAAMTYETDAAIVNEVFAALSLSNGSQH